MSLNAENLFVKCSDVSKVVEIVENHFGNASRTPQPDWGIPSSFDSELANEPKRKIAISSGRDNWIALVESKEVVDFALAKALSEKLDTTVLVIQVYEVSGAAGYASAHSGQLLETRFNEENEDPLGSVRAALKKYGVPFDAILFRDAVQGVREGWTLRQRMRG